MSNVQHDLQKIINLAYYSTQWQSLFVFKPSNIIKFNILDYTVSDNFNKKKEILLHRLDINESLIDNIPYKFSYTFADYTGKISTLQLIDWEIYELTRKLIKTYKHNSAIILKILRSKYFYDLACKRDVYFFLGSNKYWHIRKSKNPFMIIGIFYPPKIEENENISSAA